MCFQAVPRFFSLHGRCEGYSEYCSCAVPEAGLGAAGAYSLYGMQLVPGPQLPAAQSFSWLNPQLNSVT